MKKANAAFLFAGILAFSSALSPALAASNGSSKQRAKEVTAVVNAVDGMLAREHGQKSALGAYLNEIGDVVSDAALYAPFAIIAPFSAPWIFAIILLATLTEFAGVTGASLGSSRRYDGPMGKSDRAVVFGVLGAWIAIGGALPDWTFWLQPLLCLLLVATTVKRIANGINETETG